MLDDDTEKLTYQDHYQINGSSAHKSIDCGKYSDRKDILQGISVYSEKYDLYGKIDTFDTRTGRLTERKKRIKVIYDGYIYQIYAQYFSLVEMGYTVNELAFYSMNDNKLYIIANKMENQLRLLQNVRNKSDAVKESIDNIKKYIASLPSVCTLNELMAFEGLTSKIYFKNHFNNILWTSRKPRLKNDVINSVLDIGYTILFSFIECILLSFGFDTFCGVMHREFYMRKSLVCDLVEPFRPLIDDCIKKGINLKQVKEDDFLLINGQYRLKWEYNTKYVKILMAPLIDYKDDIFEYILFYYRAFMKSLTAEEFPTFYL